MYILSTAYLCFHVKATLFETVYLFMVGSVHVTFLIHSNDLNKSIAKYNKTNVL